MQNSRMSLTAPVAVSLVIIAFAAGCGERGVVGGRNARAQSPVPPQTVRLAPDRLDSAGPVVVHVPRPAVLRGLYVNRWAALGDRLWQVIDLAKTTEVNALVIDVKDDRGLVLYKSRVPLANEIDADTTRPMSASRLRAVLDTMVAHRIYPIARIVVAKDPLLAHAKLEWAIRRKDNLQPWLDKNDNPWLDPHQPGVWKYAADLAEEAYSLGFSEVQFDYVRFPDEKRLVSETVYPLANGRVRAQVIRDQLGYLSSELQKYSIPITIDVFGLTATDTTDMGIGQKWEKFIDRADVVLPMVYPSHFAPGTYKLGNPNAHPYATIDHALKDMKRRSAGIPGAAKIVPWYQDFTLGPPHYYAEQVRAQMKAGYDNGFQSWILWNPRSRYTASALEPEGSAPSAK
jgi:hypothetical protein